LILSLTAQATTISIEGPGFIVLRIWEKQATSAPNSTLAFSFRLVNFSFFAMPQGNPSVHHVPEEAEKG